MTEHAGSGSSSPLDLVDESSLTVLEKKHYLMALVTLASSDDGVDPSELAIIADAARRLRCELKPDDFRTSDLVAIAHGLKRPSLARAALHDLVRIARADRELEPRELSVLRYFAETWRVPLPDLAGVDWSTVASPDPDGLESFGAERRDSLGSRSKALGSADLGVRWRWVAVASAIFVGVSVLFALVAAFLRASMEPGARDPIGLVLGLFACFVTGLITGKLSPGRTVREPAIGVAVPLCVVFGLLALRSAGEASADKLLGAILGLGFVIGVQYGVALLGAWVGEGARAEG